MAWMETEPLLLSYTKLESDAIKKQVDYGKTNKCQPL
jgi:hypothetical protein